MVRSEARSSRRWARSAGVAAATWRVPSGSATSGAGAAALVTVRTAVRHHLQMKRYSSTTMAIFRTSRTMSIIRRLL